MFFDFLRTIWQDVRMNIVPYCRLPLSKQKRLLDLFLTGSTARAAARVVGVNRMTGILFFRKLRLQIWIYRRLIQRRKIKGVIEVDECYTTGGEGGREARKQGRNLRGKIALVGCISRGTRHVHIERVQDTKETTLTDFIARNTTPSVIHTDCFKGYARLARRGYRHLRVNHFVHYKNFDTGACTNLIESVWSGVKRHWHRFNGGYRNNLDLWITEAELRAESGVKNLPKALKRILRRK